MNIKYIYCFYLYKSTKKSEFKYGHMRSTNRMYVFKIKKKQS